MIFSIAIGAGYLSYVKFITAEAPTFFGYVISVLASVEGQKVLRCPVFEFVFRLFHYFIPFFVKCSKDGKVVYVRIASIKMTSKQIKVCTRIGCVGFFLFSMSAISSLLNYFALGRYILSKTLMFLVLGDVAAQI